MSYNRNYDESSDRSDEDEGMNEDDEDEEDMENDDELGSDAERGEPGSTQASDSWSSFGKFCRIPAVVNSLASLPIHRGKLAWR